MGEHGQDGYSRLDTSEALAQATAFYHKGEFLAAAQCYTACLHELPINRHNEHRIGIIYNRATCHLKLKDYENLLRDCDAVLELDPKNTKLYSRKLKALCSLGRFTEAYSVANHWTKIAPENPQAKKEHDRLNRIVTALQEQEDDGLEDSLDEPGMSLVLADGAPAAAGLDCGRNGGAEAAAEVNGTAAAPDPMACDAGGATGGSASMEPSFTCPSCDIMFGTRHELQVHRKSELHRKKMASDEENEWKYRAPPRGLTSREYSKCPRYFGKGTCRFGIRCSQAHSEGELAEWKERFEQKKERLQMAKDKDEQSSSYAEQLLKAWMNTDSPEAVMTETLEGVNVHVGSDLSVTMTTKRCTHTWTFTITSKMCLRRVLLLDDATRRHFQIAAVTVGPKKSQKSQTLPENRQHWTNPSFSASRQNVDKVYRIKVAFKTDIYGALRQNVIFDFGSEPVLTRQLSVDSKPVSDLDVTSLDLKLDETGRWDLSTKTIIPFIPSPHIKEPEEEALLRRYPPPMEGRFTVSEALLEPSLLPHLYKTRMHDLLYIEEMAQFSSISKFNVKTTVQIVDRFMLMPSTVTVAKFAQGGELFAQMRLMSDISEDTAQGRLILQNVSHVYIAPYDPRQEEREGPQSQDPDKVYEAFVEEKGKNFIFIRLSAQCVNEMKLSIDQEFSAQVQFQLNRLPLCEMHDAVDRLPDEHFVFPDLTHLDHIPWNPQRQWSDKLDIRLNAKQKEAIVAITTDTIHRLPPILIVGPYGTGKTFTLAQATKQILKQEGTRVLICTHSNSAADLYIKDYLHPYVEEGHPEARPLRIYYRQRWTNTVHPVVFEYCLVINRGTPQVQFFRPTREDVESHRVIVCTLSTTRYLYDLGLDQNCFSHILLDESAQAMEAETIMPMAVAGSKTRIVLAGDHMQLSPEVHSDFARDRNLHVSLLERMYDLYPYSNPCRILLCENYRSHKVVLDYTSELFYDNKLVASGSQPRHELFYPLSFFTARGEDLQHQNSTTFYNNSEVYELVERVSELSKMWPKCWGSIDDNGIGVVSPYSDQVIRIRAELRKRKLYNVSVERVLNVQGKQFRAIFLSTVRTEHTCSADDSLEDYIDYGFLSNVKLLNTAITRAQSLVAVVGDPISLCTIGKCRKLWERFIEICNKNNSLHGITWNVLRSQLDGVELKKTYVLNPLAPEFVPNRLRHACYSAPEPVGFGKYGYTFTSQAPRSSWLARPHGAFLPPQQHLGMYYPQPMMPMQYVPPMSYWPQQSRTSNHALTTAAATLTGSPITLPVTSQKMATTTTTAASYSSSFDTQTPTSTTPTSSVGNKQVAAPKAKPQDAQLNVVAAHNGSPLGGTPVSVFQPPLPRLGYQQPAYQQPGPRPPFFPSAHLVPQVYAMGPHYMMPPQPPSRTHPPPGSAPLGAHNLLGAPITHHQLAPLGIYPLSTVGTAVSAASTTNTTPSPMSPLQTWPSLPPASSAPAPPPAPVAMVKEERPSPNTTTAAKSPLQAPAIDTNHNSVQLLPNVCNASPEVKGAVEAGQRSVAGGHQAMENGFKNPFNIDPKLLFQNGILQRELYNYIQQTQGQMAAHNFMRSLEQQQQQQQPHPNPHTQLQQQQQKLVQTIFGVGSNQASQEQLLSRQSNGQRGLLRNRNQYTELVQKGRGRHETVSVKTEEAVSHDGPLDTGQLGPVSVGAPSDTNNHLVSGVRGVGGHDASSSKPLGYSAPMMNYGLQTVVGSAATNNVQQQARGKEEWTPAGMVVAGLGPGHHPPVQGPLVMPPPHDPVGMGPGPPGWEHVQNGISHTLPFGQPGAAYHHRKRYNSAGTGRVPLPHHRQPQRQVSNESHPEELLTDPELPSAVDHMVRYIEDSLEDKYHESELGNIHIGHNPLKTSLSAPGGSGVRPGSAEVHAPLYMRRGSNSAAVPGRNMSYAGALRSQPQPPAHAAEAEATSENPLDLLKNLNIKASPGTQAFYQYFS